MIKAKLLKQWEAARDDLGLEIVAPFEIDLGNNVKVLADILVKDFGGRNGTLVVTSYDVIKSYQEQLRKFGYGFSVLSEPSGEPIYDREVFVDMLSEWEWTGKTAAKPCWIKAVAD
jgi:hypothetical protein